MLGLFGVWDIECWRSVQRIWRLTETEDGLHFMFAHYKNQWYVLHSVQGRFGTSLPGSLWTGCVCSCANTYNSD